MKVSVLQENLARGLSIVSRAVSPRSTLPVLANVLVATDEGRLRLSATNLELGITCWIGAKIEEEGSTTVPARTFTDLVTHPASDNQVDMALTVRTQTLNVRCGASNTDMKCIDAQEFPPMPVADFSQGLELNVADFKEMIQQVAFAASTDDARPILTGVLVTVQGRPDHHGRRRWFPPLGAQGHHLLAGRAPDQRGHPGPRPERAGAHRRRWRQDRDHDAAATAAAR